MDDLKAQFDLLVGELESYLRYLSSKAMFYAERGVRMPDEVSNLIQDSIESFWDSSSLMSDDFKEKLCELEAIFELASNADEDEGREMGW